MNNFGIDIIRFTNKQILNDFENVKNRIIRVTRHLSLVT